METTTHIRLLGHLRFLAQAMENPAVIRRDWEIARALVPTDKGRKHVLKFFFIEPTTRTMVPVNADDIGFGGLSSYGRPVRDTLWGHATEVCNSISVAPEDQNGYFEMGSYDTILDCLRQVGTDEEVLAMHNAEDALPDVKARMAKVIAIAERFAELNEPVNPADIMHPYNIELAQKRYGLYKTNAGLELIKALRLIKHPQVRRELAMRFGRVLHDTNPDLAGVLLKIK